MCRNTTNLSLPANMKSHTLTSTLQQRLEELPKNSTQLLLKSAMHGIEKEGLRVSPSGELSQRPHPEGLGSALTNSYVTTDFSESLLELITPVFAYPSSALRFLEDLHSFTYDHLGDELIWAGSMPCRLPDPALIPIARYGSSNRGQFKHIYRIGLAHRYGRVMQCIAGIHYNFSLSDEFWKALQEVQRNLQPLQSFRSACYFRMIRNFRRHSWLLLYLFGASPALCESFLAGSDHGLEKLHADTLYLPYATSMRMSDLGYSNRVQSTRDICFNHLHTYLDSLVQATRTPHPPYQKIGVKVDGGYRQINDTFLQIENEHYSDVRPKRVSRSGERPLLALRQYGVEYIEVRNTDVNPFLPVGIDLDQTLFLDTFLISCLFMDEHEITPEECRMVSDNLKKVVTRGREPGLRLKTAQGGQQLAGAGRRLLDCMLITAGMLDEVHRTNSYSASVNSQFGKLEDAAQTPSARVLDTLRETGMEYTDWVLHKSREHKKSLHRLSPESGRYRELSREAEASLQKQHRLETDREQSFDQFLRQYLTMGETEQAG